MSEPLLTPGELGALDAEIQDLRQRMHAEGDLLTPQAVGDLWAEFSGSYEARWLVVNETTFGNFTGWLIRRALR